MEYYSAMKKNEILPFLTTLMDLEGIVLSEISQAKEDKYHMVSFMWNLKNKINQQTKQKHTHRYGKQTLGCQRGDRMGARLNCEEIKKYKLIVTKYHGGMKYRIENISNNVATSMYSGCCVLD